MSRAQSPVIWAIRLLCGLLALLVLLAFSRHGSADNSSGVGGGGGGAASSVTIKPTFGTVTHPTIAAADTTLSDTTAATTFVDYFNPSPTATVCLNFNAVATITGTTCDGGEYTIPPLYHKSWPEGGSGVLPPLPLHAIATAGSTPSTLTVK